MKILYIITKAELGGAQKYVSELASSVLSYFPDGNVSVAAGQGSWLPSALPDSVNYYFLPKFNQSKSRSVADVIFDPLALLCIYNLIKSHHFDIIHTNSAKAGLHGRLAARFWSNSNIVHTIHGAPFLEEFSRGNMRLLTIVEKIVARYTDTMIFVSINDKKQYQKRGILAAKENIVIHNGTTALLDNAVPQAATHDANCAVVTVANLYPTKGLYYLLLAIPQVIRKFPTTKFFLIGDGPLRSDLISKAKQLGLLPNYVEFLGKQECWWEKRKFNLFVLPSIKEGCPYAILEAMAASIPVIATDVGGIPEIIENGYSGILVPHKDPDSIAKAIVLLLSNSTRRKQIAQQGFIRVTERFARTTMLEKTMAVYRRILKNNDGAY